MVPVKRLKNSFKDDHFKCFLSKAILARYLRFAEYNAAYDALTALKNIYISQHFFHLVTCTEVLSS